MRGYQNSGFVIKLDDFREAVARIGALINSTTTTEISEKLTRKSKQPIPGKLAVFAAHLAVSLLVID